jgi:choline dehydrogenase-like flavoprotein
MNEYCVVGSGPAAVACAHALLTAGARVRMLDAGLTLELSRRPVIERLARTTPEHWTRSDLDAYQTGMNPDVGGVPLKLVFGSDFAYRAASETLGLTYDHVGLRPSFALGGLTNVWGAAMMPYAASDMSEWPFAADALAGHYAAVVDLVGLAGQQDDLAARFPLFTKNLTQLELSGQSRHLLATMEQNREALQRAGMVFGRSRLAVRGNRPAASDGCVYCRLCMYGCPYDLIYTSAHTVAQLQRQAQFTYQSGVVVTAAREVPGSVEISGHRLGTREPLVWRADRVFLAAGAIPTTQILLRSLGAYDQLVTLKDSQYFLVPLLAKRIRGASSERSFGLGQLYVELFDPAGRAKSAHVQFYSNSDLINAAVANAFGPFRDLLGFLVRNLQDRLLVAQGYVHSDYSSRITVRLRRGESGGAETLELRGETNPGAAEAVRAVVRKLSRHSRQLGARPLTPMLKIANPGRSFHSGGSFPMREKPRGFETDLLGRAPGWSRIHAVDATVFPSIPATTITLSAMANAHRIGVAAAQLDRDA